MSFYTQKSTKFNVKCEKITYRETQMKYSRDFSIFSQLSFCTQKATKFVKCEKNYLPGKPNEMLNRKRPILYLKDESYY